MNIPYHGSELHHGHPESPHAPRPGQAAATGAVLLAGFITLLLSGQPAALVPFLVALVIIEVPWTALWYAVRGRKPDHKRKER